MSKRNVLKSRIRGSIIGTAIGDALGAPFENMSRDQISSISPSLECFHKNVSHPELQPGQWTDDTQLMRPIIWSIIESKAIDPYGIARLTRKVFEEETLRGWSKSTISAAKRLSHDVPWYNSAGESVGIGNGVAMKAAPLGICLSKHLVHTDTITPELRHAINSIISVGQITHNEIGIIGGVMQSVLVGLSINGEKNKRSILKILAMIESGFFGKARFTDRLKNAVKFESISDIADMVGVDSKADRSWVSAAAVFLNTIKREDAQDRMIVLIKQGGDCDTTGAMFGALAGARWGVSAFSPILRKDLEKQSELLSLANKIYSTLEI